VANIAQTTLAFDKSTIRILTKSLLRLVRELVGIPCYDVVLHFLLWVLTMDKLDPFNYYACMLAAPR